MNIVIIGLSITSSWGNGHATTYRGLVRELSKRGHDVLFLERDVEWYASNRDMPKPPFGHTELYDSVDELKERFADHVRDADAVIVGSYVHDGIAIGEWVTNIARGAKAFYDIDTPVTLAKLAMGNTDYLSRALIPKYDVYLSFTGGPTLRRIEREFGSPMARALYCSFDPALYFPEPHAMKWDLGYMGTYSDDRQPQLDALMLEAARQWPEGKFIVVGPMYPDSIRWPANLERIVHLSPREHRAFYNAQKFTLNITRADMRAAGYSPSVRLFEAAACATPIISDEWDGIGELFEIGEEILISHSAEETLRYLRETPEEKRREIGERARQRVLREHTAAHRAEELENHLHEAVTRHERISKTVVNGSPSPLNGERAGVRGGRSLTRLSRNEAADGTTPRPHSLSPLKGEGGARSSVSTIQHNGERDSAIPPHPDPLPQGEGTEGEPESLLRSAPRESSAGLADGADSRERRNTILPLPKGEGRGEGEEDDHNSHDSDCAESTTESGGKGDAPVRLGHWPNEMEARSGTSRTHEKSKVTSVPSGESPDRTGGSPVPPKVLRPAYSPENYVYSPAV